MSGVAGLGGVVAAEWYKLRSVRSTGAVLGAVAGFMLLCVLWSWYVARYWDGLTDAQRATAETAPGEQPLAVSLPVCAVVLGALTLTSEYSTGMIRTTLAAMPRRGTLLMAKAGVAAATLGAVLRSTAATITSGMAVLFVLPPLARLLPAPWDERIWSALPGALANQIAGPPGSSGGHGALPPPVAAGLLAAYAAVALGAGAYAFARRDA
ncbi:hypothetical protein [Actinomadura latina]|uniref:ABC transporter permease n=1 Tax=Actinomadura latina TaxID=163603 RepID=A0A846YTE9_9ACTN|nr:hypothetical protein [Actinomadura latina]NKZ03381.1 hypothetical protein [Actinomadura latina]